MELIMDTKDKRKLLALARETLENALGEEVSAIRDSMEKNNSPALHSLHGAFVTLKRKVPDIDGPGKLRGCIGYMTGKKPLWKLIQDLAVEAAFEDPRFPSVKIEELPDLSIEISVLSPPQPIQTPSQFEPGIDGVILSLGYNRAVFLPQVATEQGWDREEMLDNLCLKAGLDPSAWRLPDCHLETFRATVFSEDDE
jgi:AmmeMemoRadiSam system protein A